MGVSHGDDVFLIYNNRYNLSSYTKEETEIGRYFVAMYREFSNANLVSFGNKEINAIKADDMECMEINSSFDYSMTKIGKTFGQIDFWNSLNIPE